MGSDWCARAMEELTVARMRLVRMEQDLARVTAERDDYRSRWEQTGCTRHHAMETAIKLNESCRQQLESAIQERDSLCADNDALRWLLRQIVNDLPTNRDWLDPDVEKVARAALKVGQGEGEG